MFTDATSGRCDGKNICVRNYSTKELTYFVPTKGKGKKYIEETNILNRYTGNLVHDHETVIYNYGNKHIECNVHVLRYLKGCYENTKNKWAKDMMAYLCSLNNYRKQLISEGVTYLDEEKLKKYSKRIIGTLKKQGRNFYKEIINIYEEVPVEIK